METLVGMTEFCRKSHIYEENCRCGCFTRNCCKEFKKLTNKGLRKGSMTQCNYFSANVDTFSSYQSIEFILSSPEFLVPVCVTPDYQSELTWKCGELKGGAPPESNNKCNYTRSDSKSDNEPLLSHSSCEKCTNVITLSFPANTIPKRFHYDISSDGAVTISFLDIMSF